MPARERGGQIVDVEIAQRRLDHALVGMLLALDQLGLARGDELAAEGEGAEPPACEKRRMLQRQNHGRQFVEALQRDLAHDVVAVHGARMHRLPVLREERCDGR